MSRVAWLTLCSLLLALTGASAQCTVDPNKDFFQNFDNPCYAITFADSMGAGLAGDSNAGYGLAYFKVNPRYEFIVYGIYPQTRYYSIAVNDDHIALTSSIFDQQIQPLTDLDTNPYGNGVAYLPGQRYAVTVSVGGVEPQAGNIQQGCSVSAYNIHGNTLLGNIRHTGIDWTGDPNLPRNFPAHIGTPPLAGSIMVRRYVEDPANLQRTKLLVRDLTTGCAVPVSTAVNTLVTTDMNVGGGWNDGNQASSHEKYANTIQPKLCYEVVPNNALLWERNAEYIPGINPNAAYLSANVPSSVKRQIGLLSSSVLRIRMRLPTTPPTPCDGCSLSGNEQLRYWSMSFMNGAKTIVSLSDQDVVEDSNGYITVIISLGGKQPANAIAANGYAYLNINPLNGTKLSAINIRYILPASGYICGASNIPFLTTEDNPMGGYMGDYSPTADVISGGSLPLHADPNVQPDTCSVKPLAPPQNCTVFYPKLPLLGGLSLP